MPLSTSLSRAFFGLLGASLLVACSKEPAPGGEAPAAPARASAAPAAASSAAPAASPARSAPAAASSAVPSNPLCEVELSGHVRGVPAGKFGTIMVSEGDCLAPGAPLLGRSGVAGDGRFFIEVFTKWGTDLSVCAAYETAPNKPSTLYTKAVGAFHAEATGEIEFKNMELTLKPGPPLTFASKLSPSKALAR